MSSFPPPPPPPGAIPPPFKSFYVYLPMNFKSFPVTDEVFANIKKSIKCQTTRGIPRIPSEKGEYAPLPSGGFGSQTPFGVSSGSEGEYASLPHGAFSQSRFGHGIENKFKNWLANPNKKTPDSILGAIDQQCVPIHFRAWPLARIHPELFKHLMTIIRHHSSTNAYYQVIFDMDLYRPWKMNNGDVFCFNWVTRFDDANSIATLIAYLFVVDVIATTKSGGDGSAGKDWQETLCYLENVIRTYVYNVAAKVFQLNQRYIASLRDRFGDEFADAIADLRATSYYLAYPSKDHAVQVTMREFLSKIKIAATAALNNRQKEGITKAFENTINSMIFDFQYAQHHTNKDFTDAINALISLFPKN